MVMRNAAEKFCSDISRRRSASFEQQVQLLRQTLCTAGFIEIDGDAFIPRHLAEVIDSRR